MWILTNQREYVEKYVLLAYPFFLGCLSIISIFFVAKLYFWSLNYLGGIGLVP